MAKELKCPVCYEVVYSGVGKECKMCGMVLEDKSREFCSKMCRVNYFKINKTKASMILLLVLISLTGFVSAHSGDDGYSHHGMMSCFYGGGFSGMNFFGWMFMALVLVALVLVIVWLAKQIQGPGGKRR